MRIQLLPHDYCQLLVDHFLAFFISHSCDVFSCGHGFDLVDQLSETAAFLFHHIIYDSKSLNTGQKVIELLYFVYAEFKSMLDWILWILINLWHELFFESIQAVFVRIILLHGKQFLTILGFELYRLAGDKI